jgi:16S rRNA (guanine527-N7)-methyltransferase
VPLEGTDSSAPEVPRETDTVAEIFGGRVSLARRYVELLATSGVERGLIGPREVPRLWERHVLNCAVVAELVPPAATLIDVGSGAGLPGIPLALARPDLEVTLLEPLLRRTTWLEEILADLELKNVTVLRDRAETAAAAGFRADVVTARAVAPLDRLAGWCLPLARPGGLLLALKGASALEELTAAASELHRFGAGATELASCGAAVLEEPTTVVVIRRSDAELGRPAARGPRQKRRR